MIRLLQRLIKGRGGHVRTPEELVGYLEGTAAYLAQSSVFAYGRARTGVLAPKLFTDAPFVDAISRCRWHTFAATLQDLSIVVAGELQRHGAETNAIHDLFSKTYDDILARQERPADLEATWRESGRQFAERLKAALASAPRDPGEVAEYAGHVLVDFAPFHESLAELDRDMVVNNMKFRMLRVSEDLPKQVDLPRLASALAGVGAAE